VDHAGEKLQWAQTLYITHGPSFGHKIYLATQIQGRDPEVQMDWSWRGLGIPPEVVKSVGAFLTGVFEEHVLFRYGVADPLFPGDYSPAPAF
jgi:hypothetical protein